VVRWYRINIAKNGKQEDLDRLEFTLDQPNPRLHLYTLAQRRARPALPPVENGFMAAMQEINTVKTGG
jgi:hypothetical protein